MFTISGLLFEENNVENILFVNIFQSMLYNTKKL